MDQVRGLRLGQGRGLEGQTRRSGPARQHRVPPGPSSFRNRKNFCYNLVRTRNCPGKEEGEGEGEEQK